MPRYFFNIRDNASARDDAGAECADHEAARKLAVQALSDIARDEIPREGDQHAFTVLVTDESRQPVFSATLNYAGRWLTHEA